MLSRAAAVVAAVAGVLLLAPSAQAAGKCPGTLPAKLTLPSSEVNEFERRSYVGVRPRDDAKLRDVRVKLKFGSVTVARGVVDGKLRGKRSVPLEFREPIEADRNYDFVTSADMRGCKDRERTTKLASFTDAGGGGGGGGVPGQLGANVQGLTLDWSGGAWQGNDSREVNLPGIGRGIVVCRPDTQWLRVIPDDPNRSTAIVAFTYRRWDDAFEEGSVQEASTNPFGGGEFNLGFNKFGPTPEKQSTGTLTGVISDRLAFDAAGGVGAPPTAVELSWQWDFRSDSDSRCHVDANFTTEAAGAEPPLARSLFVNWRGDGSATGNSAWTAEIPGLGEGRIDCLPGVSGIKRFTLFAEPGVSPASFVAYEGSEVRTSTQTQSPYRYELPNNGVIVADFGPGRGKLFLSSRWKSNDPDPAQNFCHLAGILVGV